MANFGETLKRERELREISLRQISEATKINIRYLEALEENRFDALPGGLFNKGFIRAYSNYIGIDGEAMVNTYLQEVLGRAPGGPTAAPREHPQLHRPAEVPQRRASARPVDTARDRQTSREQTARDRPAPAAREQAALPAREPTARVRLAPPARGGGAEARDEGTSNAAASDVRAGSGGASDTGASVTDDGNAGLGSAAGGNAGASGAGADNAGASGAVQAGAAPAEKAAAPERPATPAKSAAPWLREKPAAGKPAASAPSAKPGAAEHRAKPLLPAPAPPRRTLLSHDPIIEGLERLQNPRPAVTGIEVADQATPRSSRVLVWILSMVAAAGVLFVVLSLLRGSPPPASHLATQTAPGQAGASRSVAAGSATGGTTGSAAGGAAAGETRPGGPAGAQALLPDMSSASPIALGALDSPRPKSAAAPAPAPTRTPAPRAAKPLPPPVPETLAAVEPQTPYAHAPTRDSMDVTVETSVRAFVQVICDGKEKVNRIMEEGETVSARCYGVVRISSADAGATSVSVNGSACLPLGDRGTRAYGYTIRIDDYNRICPPAGRGDDGRP